MGNPGSSSSDPVTQYNKLDFDDMNEYITFYSSETSNTLQLSVCMQCWCIHDVNSFGLYYGFHSIKRAVAM